MKKISLFALALGTSLAMFAQNQPQLVTPMSQAVRFGIKGALNIADVKASNSSVDYTHKTKSNFAGGFLVNIPMGTVLRLQPELVYSGQGTRITQTNSVGGGSTSSSYQWNLGYINLPVLLQAQTKGGFFVETGPQLGYLITAKQKADNMDDIDVKDYLKKWDISWVGGIGYLSRVGLGIDARYAWGLRNIVDEDNSTLSSQGKVRNRVVQVGLFYQFGAGK